MKFCLTVCSLEDSWLAAACQAANVRCVQQSLLVLEVCCLGRPLSGGRTQRDFPTLFPEELYSRAQRAARLAAVEQEAAWDFAEIPVVQAQWLQRPIGNLEFALLCRVAYFFSKCVLNCSFLRNSLLHFALLR